MKKPGRNDLCACGSGRKAKNCCEQADVAVASETSNELLLKTFQAGLDHHRAGNIVRAERLYNDTLLLDPNYARSIHHLGLIAMQKGDNAGAIKLINKSLALDPSSAAAYNDLGTVLQAEGQLRQAISAYHDALKFNANYPEAYNNLGVAQELSGNFPIAVENFKKAISLVRTYRVAHVNLARVYEKLGRPIDATNTYVAALALQEDGQARWGFSWNVILCDDIARVRNVEALLIRAITEPWARPESFSPTVVRLLKSAGPLNATIARAARAWPTRLTKTQFFADSGFSACVSNPLLSCILQNCCVADIELECLLTSARAAMLEAAGERTASGAPAQAGALDEILSFTCALAKQCFINGYVYDCTDEEEARVQQIKDQLAAALAANASPPPLWIAVLAAYESLAALPDRAAILQQAWPASVHSVLAQQILLPQEQEAMKPAFPKLTPIAEESHHVQAMYEESPYPVWTGLEPDDHALSINAFAHQRFPGAPFTPLPEKPRYDVLIAGCGTGQQSNEASQNYANVDVTAVDLSLSSLAYAKQKSDQLGKTNLHYMQADIMRLGEISERFDMIECTGVLHHLGDPAAGWRILTSLLRPSALLRIALYSELARKFVVNTREYIAEQGYQPNLKDIRRLRQDLIVSNDPRFSAVFGSPDFYSTNNCRDLLFHVQEHRFTIPQFKALIEETGLVFLGFLMEPRFRDAYWRAYPDDPAGTNLDNWHQYELDNPGLFGAMYQFYVQRPA